jgi:hypothetical protein
MHSMVLQRKSFPRVIVAAGVVLLLFHLQARSQPMLLDGFDTLAGWRTIVSDGAKLTLTQEGGKTDNAMAMNFDLSGVYGYVIAEKDFQIDLPPNYQFTFDMRADAPVNNFEFKVIDDRENVYWIKKLNVHYPKEWAKQRIKKRHLAFAWGPAPGKELKTVRKIQFVVSCGTGGTGTVLVDNFRFEPIDDDAGKNAVAEIITAGPERSGSITPRGTVLTGWNRSAAGRDSLVVDFHRRTELGGLLIDWDSSAYPLSYDVLVSDDGNDWSKVYAVHRGKPGLAVIPLHEAEGRRLKLVFGEGKTGRGYSIRRMETRGPEFSSTPNALFHALASDAPHGYYPKYFLNKQSYWTVVGVNGDSKESLVNEQGQVEVDKLQFSLEPFLWVDDTLVTWSSVTTQQFLFNGYVPVPLVRWNYRDRWLVDVEPSVAGFPGNSLLGVHYRVTCKSGGGRVRLFVAMRPFQVVPPWQQLNIDGGVSRIDSITYRHGYVTVNGMTVIPLTLPSGFGATEFDQGQITDYLSHGNLPSEQSVYDHTGFASAALSYDLNFPEAGNEDVVVIIPLHNKPSSPVPNMRPEMALAYFDLMVGTEARRWVNKLGTFSLQLPPSAQSVSNTILSTLAYIFINRDGPGIQPGSRTYERSWIRDGSLTCSALLRTGHPEEVKEFLDWYAKNQFPSGKIPCVVDSRGPDAVPEHDSNGEFIYGVLQYFLFTKDTVWLRGKYDNIVKTVRFLQGLRAERKTDLYRNGTPAQRALYGLVPESISHEGYWDTPRHSYWDDFFTLRGFKDATTIAGILGEKKDEAEFAAERDDFRTDLYASMRLAMKNTNISYIPGCAELGDFDATSTTIGVLPGGELGNIPEPQLHNTFDKYYSYFVNRKTNDSIANYTPYETRVIGTFVLLGQKQRAQEAMEFFMKDRRPAGWNEWGEVVWRDPDAPKYIGDMPHTWVGSDFIRSILTMFIYERERDGAVVLAAGIPDGWVRDSAGVKISGIRTYDGSITYSLKTTGKRVVAEVSGTVAVPGHTVVMTSPLSARLRSVKVNGVNVRLPASREVVLPAIPCRVEFGY